MFGEYSVSQYPSEAPECSADLPVPLVITWTSQVKCFNHTRYHKMHFMCETLALHPIHTPLNSVFFYYYYLFIILLLHNNASTIVLITSRLAVEEMFLLMKGVLYGNVFFFFFFFCSLHISTVSS